MAAALLPFLIKRKRKKKMEWLCVWTPLFSHRTSSFQTWAYTTSMDFPHQTWYSAHQDQQIRGLSASPPTTLPLSPASRRRRPWAGRLPPPPPLRLPRSLSGACRLRARSRRFCHHGPSPRAGRHPPPRFFIGERKQKQIGFFHRLLSTFCASS